MKKKEKFINKLKIYRKDVDTIVATETTENVEK